MYSEKVIKEIRAGGASLRIPAIKTVDQLSELESLLRYIWPHDPFFDENSQEEKLDMFCEKREIANLPGTNIWDVVGKEVYIKTYPYHLLFSENYDIIGFIDRCHREIVHEPQCMMFHMLLALEFPEALPYSDNDHIITKIGFKFYDWNGEVVEKDRFRPFNTYGTRWIFNHYNAIVSKIKETYN